MSRKALVAGVSSYSDRRLNAIPSAQIDLEQVRQVLADPELGGYVVTPEPDPSDSDLRRAIARILGEAGPDDQLLIYYSGHGLLDSESHLHLCCSNTESSPAMLHATSVTAEFLLGALSRSSAREVVVILDCCFAAAVSQGFKRGGHQPVEIGIPRGEGRVILAASGVLQGALDGADLDGVIQPSVYTSVLVEGIRTGSADFDNDGVVSARDLNNYALRRLRQLGANQVPRSHGFDEFGEIIVSKVPLGRRDLRLPIGFEDGLRNPLPEIRRAVLRLLPEHVVDESLRNATAEALLQDPADEVKAEATRLLTLNAAGRALLSTYRRVGRPARTSTEAEFDAACLWIGPDSIHFRGAAAMADRSIEVSRAVDLDSEVAVAIEPLLEECRPRTGASVMVAFDLDISPDMRSEILAMLESAGCQLRGVVNPALMVAYCDARGAGDRIGMAVSRSRVAVAHVREADVEMTFGTHELATIADEFCSRLISRWNLENPDRRVTEMQRNQEAMAEVVRAELAKPLSEIVGFRVKDLRSYGGTPVTLELQHDSSDGLAEILASAVAELLVPFKSLEGFRWLSLHRRLRLDAASDDGQRLPIVSSIDFPAETVSLARRKGVRFVPRQPADLLRQYLGRRRSGAWGFRQEPVAAIAEFSYLVSTGTNVAVAVTAGSSLPARARCSVAGRPELRGSVEVTLLAVDAAGKRFEMGAVTAHSGLLSTQGTLLFDVIVTVDGFGRAQVAPVE